MPYYLLANQTPIQTGSHCVLFAIKSPAADLTLKRCVIHLNEREWNRTTIVYHEGTDLQSAATPPIVAALP